MTIREPGQRAGLPESVSPKCWPPKNAVSQQLAEEGDEGREGLCKSESPQQDSQSFPEVIRTERVKERENSRAGGRERSKGWQRERIIGLESRRGYPKGS